MRSALARLPASDALRATLARLLVLHEEPDAALSLLQSKEFFIAESNAELIDLYREAKLSQGLLLLKKGQTTSATGVLLEAGKLPGTIAASDFERSVVPKLAYYQGYAHWLRGEGEVARKVWQSIAEMSGLEGEDAYFAGRALDRLDSASAPSLSSIPWPRGARRKVRPAAPRLAPTICGDWGWRAEASPTRRAPPSSRRCVSTPPSSPPSGN